MKGSIPSRSAPYPWHPAFPLEERRIEFPGPLTVSREQLAPSTCPGVTGAGVTGGNGGVALRPDLLDFRDHTIRGGRLIEIRRLGRIAQAVRD